LTFVLTPIPRMWLYLEIVSLQRQI
jgi:hypothetical protein